MSRCFVNLNLFLLLCCSPLLFASLPVTSGLLMHLDAASITGFSDGASIATWSDISGAGNHATQGTSANRPVYNTSNPLFNGYASVHFDGTDDWMDLEDNIISTSSFTAFVVAKFDSFPSSVEAFLLKGGSTASRRFKIKHDHVRNNFMWHIADTSYDSIHADRDTEVHIFGATSTVEGFLDGTSVGPASPAGTGSVDSFSVGNNLPGDIAEVILYNRLLSSTEVQQVNDYLAAKYFTPLTPTGLTASPGNNSISLNWDDNEIEPESYTVYRSLTSEGSYSEIASGILTSAYADDTAVNGTPYYYIVTALNSGYESGNSSEASATPQIPTRYMEDLDRGVVAVYKGSNQVYIGWRLFGTDPSNIAFNIYRNITKINSSPITNSTNYIDTAGSSSSTYRVATVIDGVEQGLSNPVSTWSYFKESGFDGAAGYHDIPLQRPAGGTTPDGDYDYSPNDASVGDLDGDGQYEIVLKWDPSNSRDNWPYSYTGNVYLDAYEIDGTFLWRIDLGVNIQAGPHYTQFMVYDMDRDGIAEVVCKTADGTTDYEGTIIGNPTADWRNEDGAILDGPEYLSIFDGQTGAVIDTVDYIPARGDISDWGDDYGNRVDRFLACVAYLDGQNPSIVMTRGYYAKTVLAAWDFVDGQLSLRWVFDSTDPGNSAYEGQGCHSLSVADVDDDGFDEIIFGSCTIDDDGSGLYSTGYGHGDALHVSDMDPSRPGLEVWQCHEHENPPGLVLSASFRDAETGVSIWEQWAGDNGRCLAAHIDSDEVGYQLWSYAADGTYNVDGTQLSTDRPTQNFAVWWTGDLQRELLDTAGDQDNPNPKLDKWNSSTNSDYRFLNIYRIPNDNWDTKSNNYSKATPCLSGDILGDWREEMIFRDRDNTKLRILTTTDLTNERIYTLMHDSQYREAIAWQNVGYNQPPHPSFYIGTGMSTPPTPNIQLVGAKFNPADIVEDGRIDLVDFFVLAAQWQDSPGIPAADIAPLGADDFSAGDGIINGLDLQLLCEHWLVIEEE